MTSQYRQISHVQVRLCRVEVCILLEVSSAYLGNLYTFLKQLLRRPTWRVDMGLNASSSSPIGMPPFRAYHFG